jgi:hypothetical protein
MMYANPAAADAPFSLEDYINWDGLESPNLDTMLTLPIDNSGFVATDGVVPQEDIDSVWNPRVDTSGVNENTDIDLPDSAPFPDNVARDEIAAYFFDATGAILPIEQSVS